jgi:hypothetical protein
MITQNYLSILVSVQIQHFMRSLATQSKAEVEVDENKRTCVGGIKANILAKGLSGDASEMVVPQISFIVPRKMSEQGFCR